MLVKLSIVKCDSVTLYKAKIVNCKNDQSLLEFICSITLDDGTSSAVLRNNISEVIISCGSFSDGCAFDNASLAEIVISDVKSSFPSGWWLLIIAQVGYSCVPNTRAVLNKHAVGKFLS